MKTVILFFSNRGGRNLIASLILLFLFNHSIWSQECMYENLGQIFEPYGSRSDCDNVEGMSRTYIIPVAIHVIRANNESQIFPTDANIDSIISFANILLKPEFTLVAISNPEDCTQNCFRPIPRFDDIDKTNELEIKNLSRIDPSRVCNIWIVQNAFGGDAKGFAYNPRSSNLSNDLDGIVLAKKNVLSLMGETLAHEFGHYLGLHHVWGRESFDQHINCHEPSESCIKGDEVSDTPRCLGDWPFSNTDCSYNIPQWTGSNRPWCVHGDPYPCSNLMNFGSSRSVITQGQRDRMIYTLNNYRPNLGAYINSCLNCSDPCVPCYYGTPVVDPNPIDFFCSPCNDAHIHFEDQTINGVITINQPTLITKDLIINGTLIVKNHLYVAPGKSIRVMQGGKLDINQNGHITSCSGMWNGVYVYRGLVTMLYGGTISKALNGIYISLEGSLVCDDAEFFENINGVVLNGPGCSASFNTARFFGMNNGVQLFGLVNPV